MSKFLTDDQIDMSPISAMKMAIIGYGSQGRSHALNLRDSGINVVVGQRDNHQGAESGFQQAIQDGFEPVAISQSVNDCDLICVMLPDEVHGPVFKDQIRPHLSSDKIVLTCHGFSLHYGLIELPENVASVLVAPKGAGHRVRSAFTEGSGVPCLVAPGPNANQHTIDVGLAYAKAIGGGRTGVLMTTVAEETETDLFGEQAVLCGGVSALVKAGFETLVKAGYQPEVAYFECVHELKLVVDLLHKGGLAYMRDHISNTAEYGDYTRGPRIVNESTRETMRQILDEIKSGDFAKEFIAATSETGRDRFEEMRKDEKRHPIEQTGKSISQL